MAVGYDIGLSASQSSGAQTGTALTGDFTVTGGGGGGLVDSLFPKLPTTQAWIVYVVVGVVVLIGLTLWLKRK